MKQSNSPKFPSTDAAAPVANGGEVGREGPESAEPKQKSFATDGAPMNTDEKRFDWITETIIGCAYKVASKLGYGFLEQCYENALSYELRNKGLRVQQQARLQVWYDDIVVGEYIADLIVEDVVLVELKAISALEAIHSAVCINYLAATKLPLCLLINFGRRVDVKRIAGPTLSTARKETEPPSDAK